MRVTRDLLCRMIKGMARRLGAQDGAVLLYVLSATLAVLALSGAALAAVTYDVPTSTVDSSQKQAYAAAQAGIQRYLFELNTDNTYWTQCVPQDQSTGQTPEWIYNTGQAETDPQPVPGPVPGRYAVMLLPAAGQTTYTQCSTADPVDSMLATTGADAGTLRIAATGYVGTAQRTIVAAIRQRNFLDYAYFTTYETSDPIVQVEDAFASTNDQDTAMEPPDECAANATGCGASYESALNGVNTTYPGATAQCSQYRSARQGGAYKGVFFANSYTSTSGGKSRSRSVSFSCTDIQFIAGDQINGPFHSNDSVLICGKPSFGQSGHDDAVEFGGSPGWIEASGCSGAPTINGTLTAPDTPLNMPEIVSLAKVASPSLTYQGTTCLDFTTAGVGVAHPTAGQSCATSTLSYTNVPYTTINDDGGVLYVDSGACDATYDVDQPNYTVSTANIGCGTVYVQGADYGQVTIGADQDIVIDGNLTYGNTSAMLGLIANGFIRVYHPVNGDVCTSSGATNASEYTPVTQIDAAMLSLQHSFIVDDYSCGANLGTLNVDGAIAQNFRGVVGSGSSGYTKNYVYDRRLQYETPPHFLAPTNAGYEIAHQTECDVAASCDGTN